MLSENGLARAMKLAYKTGGYTVLRDGIDTIIMPESGRWVAECRTSKMPRKVTAALAEHLGYLPDMSEAVLAKDKMDPQTVIFEDAAERYRGWISAEQTTKAAQTACIFSGYHIFQATDMPGKPLYNYGVPEYLLDVLDYDPPAALICDPLMHPRAMFYDTDCTERFVVYVASAATTELAPYWQALEGVALTEPKKE